jgi:hypothetical protein
MLSSNKKSVRVNAEEVQDHVPAELRNAIYSALLSGDGLRNIEGTLDRQLAESGFKDELRRYVKDLIRSGQVSSSKEALDLAMGKIRQQTEAHRDAKKGTNGIHDTHGTDDDYDLRIPASVETEGTKVVKKELMEVCETDLD